MKFWEKDGAYFRGKDYPTEVLIKGEWKPYEGDVARVKLFGTEIEAHQLPENKNEAA